ncbi:class I SAM-dependent methyltransferase [Amycolatopsis magusensis]|uniref:class I SAM-dependent methyltransferase n=1 Tax=Amycolatopsis magusensis TaxID=882444 RepID=UPI0024A8B2D7|nr:class I SAM-dependent methyltransferase [Amycolatopsis magusensis]MDI5978275.1 class I SAM-dependent methyltransferase [Amycolatopsis magusensis]
MSFSSEWLDLREPADAAARAEELLEPLLERLTAPLHIRDLGCGTGSMARWLAGKLPGPQHWTLHDRDPALLAEAAGRLPEGVTVSTARGDVTNLSAADFAGTSLVTTSALLDLLTADEVAALATACAGVPALLTLSVVGEVELTPADPLDADLTAAFNAHQRRVEQGRQLLGPDSVAVAAEAFGRHGATVRLAASDWRLGAAEAALAAEWLTGWVGAAVEQEPALAPAAERYLRERLASCAAGELRVAVRHQDLLVLPLN